MSASGSALRLPEPGDPAMVDGPGKEPVAARVVARDGSSVVLQGPGLRDLGDGAAALVYGVAGSAARVPASLRPAAEGESDRRVADLASPPKPLGKRTAERHRVRAVVEIASEDVEVVLRGLVEDVSVVGAMARVGGAVPQNEIRTVTFLLQSGERFSAEARVVRCERAGDVTSLPWRVAVAFEEQQIDLVLAATAES